MPKIARIKHTDTPSRSSSGGGFFATLTPKKEGKEMESNDLGEILLMLLDDDLFPVQTEQEENDGVEILQP